MKRKIKQFILFLGDVVILYASLYLGLVLRHLQGIEFSFFKKHLSPFSVLYIIWLIIFFINDLYEPYVIKQGKKLFSKLLSTGIINAAIGISLFYLFPGFGVSPKTNLFLTILVSIILISAWRAICNAFINPAGSKKNVLLIGFQNEAEITQKINSRPSLHYRIKCCLSEIKNGEIKRIIKNQDIDTIVVNNEKYQKNYLKLYKFIPLGVNIYDFSSFWEKINNFIPVSAANEAWFLENLRERQKKVYENIKRGIDVLLSIIALPFYFILYPFIAIGIKATSKGSVLFKQERVGKNNKKFQIIKFRTMVQNAENGKAKWAKKNDSRVTSFGKFLRQTRLDELPQILNILKGDMSLIGPRPERPEFIDKLTKEVPHYHLRHLIKPGLTGWAQIKYSYGSSIEDAKQKLCYDLYYLKNRSFLFDLGIILKTTAIVLTGKGQ